MPHGRRRVQDGSASAAGRWARVLRDPLFGGAIAIAGFLVFLWPFVSSPPLGIAEAGLFLFAAWASAIALLAAIARALRPPARRGSRDDA